MYSVVMLAAMTAGPETPDFFFKNKGNGCTGYSAWRSNIGRVP